MDIGKPEKTITVEPVEDPFREPAPAPEPSTPAPEKEPVPAK